MRSSACCSARSRFAVGLDGVLFEGGDVSVEFLEHGGGDGDEAAVAQDAVAAVRSASCWRTSWYPAVREVSSICPILARWAWPEMCLTFFSRISQAA